MQSINELQSCAAPSPNLLHSSSNLARMRFAKSCFVFKSIGVLSQTAASRLLGSSTTQCSGIANDEGRTRSASPRRLRLRVQELDALGTSSLSLCAKTN